MGPEDSLHNVCWCPGSLTWARGRRTIATIDHSQFPKQAVQFGGTRGTFNFDYESVLSFCSMRILHVHIFEVISSACLFLSMSATGSHTVYMGYYLPFWSAVLEDTLQSMQGYDSAPCFGVGKLGTTVGKIPYLRIWMKQVCTPT